MTDAKRGALEELLVRLNHESFNRIQSGEFDYDKEIAQLDKNTDTATQIGSPYTRSRSRLTKAMLFYLTGSLEPALVLMNEVLAELNTLPEPDSQIDVLRVATYSNMVSAYGSFGEYEEAYVAAQQALALSEKIADIRPDSRAIVQVNLAHLLVALGRTDEAMQQVQDVMANYEIHSPYYDAAVAESYLIIIEAARPRADFATAWLHAQLGTDRAIKSGDYGKLATFCFAQCRLATVDPNPPSPPQTYFDKGVAALESITAPLLRGRAFLMEAYRWKHIDTTTPYVRQLCEHAKRYFIPAGLTAAVHSADRLLATLPSAPPPTTPTNDGSDGLAEP